MKPSDLITPTTAINQVFLVGKVNSPGVEKTLPSGDCVVEFRILVDREKPRGKKREVDVLDIATWNTRLRKRALSLQVDEWVEIEGSLRRRFWRGPAGLASRWQVEASEVRRI
jgi:single-strand DNA-binding protein